MWHRLRLIAAAYELDLLPVIDGSTNPMLLNSEQARMLVEDVDFVSVVSDDAAIDAVAEFIVRLAGRAEATGGGAALGIEFPRKDATRTSGPT